MQLSNQCQREVLNKWNGHPVQTPHLNVCPSLLRRVLQNCDWSAGARLVRQISVKAVVAVAAHVIDAPGFPIVVQGSAGHVPQAGILTPDLEQRKRKFCRCHSFELSSLSHLPRRRLDRVREFLSLLISSWLEDDQNLLLEAEVDKKYIFLSEFNVLFTYLSCSNRPSWCQKYCCCRRRGP